MNKDIKIYNYSRGDKYSCNVVVINDEHLVMLDIKVPENTPAEVVEQLLNNAEQEALKMNNQKGVKGW